MQIRVEWDEHKWHPCYTEPHPDLLEGFPNQYGFVSTPRWRWALHKLLERLDRWAVGGMAWPPYPW